MHFSYPNGGNYAYYNQDILAMVKTGRIPNCNHLQ